MNTKELFLKNINESIAVKQSLIEQQDILNSIDTISNLIIKAFELKQQLMLCGNGGSAADSQHLAAEFSGRYYFDRPPLKAIALHTDTSFLTAVANDFSFDDVYSRMIEAIGVKGDILIGLSTSGNSKNVVNAMSHAKEKGIITVGFTGQAISQMDNYCDYLIKVPSIDTARIQESHMIIGHTICEIVEKQMFS